MKIMKSYDIYESPWNIVKSYEIYTFPWKRMKQAVHPKRITVFQSYPRLHSYVCGSYATHWWPILHVYSSNISAIWSLTFRKKTRSVVIANQRSPSSCRISSSGVVGETINYKYDIYIYIYNYHKGKTPPVEQTLINMVLRKPKWWICFSPNHPVKTPKLHFEGYNHSTTFQVNQKMLFFFYPASIPTTWWMDIFARPNIAKDLRHVRLDRGQGW